MLTMTTYGTWLRGDQRGWVEDGQTMPAAPRLAAHDAALLKHAPFTFAAHQLELVGIAIGRALIDRAQQHVLALTIQNWHVHAVVLESAARVPDVVKCIKDAARYALRAGRPIWTAGYDKRYCRDTESLRRRIAYVERHNIERGLPPRPWAWIEQID